MLASPLPASARARAVRAPKPLEAPVMRMIFLLMVFLASEAGGKGGRSTGPLREAAVDVDDLAIDPAGRAREERDGLRDVGRHAEPLERDRLRQAVDGLLVLAVEEERRSGGTRGDRVDGDVLATQFAGQDEGHALHG